MRPPNLLCALVATSGLTCVASASTPLRSDPTASPLAGYLAPEGLASRMAGLAHERGGIVSEIEVGTTTEGRRIMALRISGVDQSRTAPALLLVAGLDGTHLVGTEVAWRIADRLAREHADLLEHVVVYVVPAVNLDALAGTHGAAGAPTARTSRPVDDDRDGVADEDGPDDLDGNGVITLMRIAEPALPDVATLVVDADDPRLLRAPDAAKGERATHRLVVEGRDDDGDGLLNEDGRGGVDLDRNFLHRWPEHEDGAGTHPLSEPESLALARFVLGHPEIALAVTYGRHDNVIRVPDGRGTDANPRVPLALDPADVAAHGELAKLYRDQTGQARAATADAAGAFHTWIYAQRGVHSLATSVWGRPDVPSADAAPPDDGAADQAAASATSAPDGAIAEGAAPTAAAPAPAPEPRRRRGGGPPGGGAARTARPPSADVAAGDVAEEKAWLAWADHTGTGFVPWAPFDHPTLGAVEIGGFMPLFKLNPPATELDALAEKQLAFVVELLRRMPRHEIDGPVVEALGGGLYRIRVAVTNTGTLPFGTSMGRREQITPPLVIRLATPVEAGIAGTRVQRVRALAAGATERFEWIVKGSPGERVGVVIAASAGPHEQHDELREIELPDSGTVRFTALHGSNPSDPVTTAPVRTTSSSTDANTEAGQ